VQRDPRLVEVRRRAACGIGQPRHARGIAELQNGIGRLGADAGSAEQEGDERGPHARRLYHQPADAAVSQRPVSIV
jgi:hypothetical protein